jgi:hypothetical protein
MTCPLIGHMHAPALHVAVDGQTLPQVPQFIGSVAMPVVQPRTPPAAVHAVVPVGHWQAPATHIDPGPQFTQPVPQCAASVIVS